MPMTLIQLHPLLFGSRVFTYSNLPATSEVFQHPEHIVCINHNATPQPPDHGVLAPTPFLQVLVVRSYATYDTREVPKDKP